jgi:hypothetical protein
MIPFWCLIPKGKKLRPKQMDQLPLVNFKNNRVRIFDLSKMLYWKIWSLAGENFLLWEKGSFWYLINFFHWNISWFAQTSVFGLEIGKWFDLQKQTKWWQRMIQICQILCKNNLVLNCIDVALLLVAFGCVGIKHQKGGDWKGNVPLGNFNNVLVIKCPTRLIKFLCAK